MAVKHADPARVLDQIENLSRTHREHELFYSQAPLEDAVTLQRISRTLKAQLTAKHSVSTPAQWQPGDNVIVGGNLSDDEARERFGDFEAPRPYIRIVPQPQ